MTKDDDEIENPDCPCTWKECPGYGKCSECQAYHHAFGDKTSCGK